MATKPRRVTGIPVYSGFSDSGVSHSGDVGGAGVGGVGTRYIRGGRPSNTTPPTSAYWYALYGDLTLQETGEIANSVVADSAGNVYAIASDDTNVLSIYLLKYSAAGDLVWQKSLNSTNPNQYAYEGAVGVDSTGNIYVTINAEAEEGRFASVLKLDSSANILWQKSITAIDNKTRVEIRDLTILPDGSLIITGNVDLGNDLFVTKISTAGDSVWQTLLGIVAEEGRGYSVALDALGNILVGGLWRVIIDNNTVSKGIIVKLSSTGTVQWQYAVTISDSGYQTILHSIAVDSTNDIGVVGTYGNDTGQRAFVLKLTSSGQLSWQHVFSSTLDAVEVAVDQSNAVYAYAAGYTVVNAQSVPTLFVKKYSATGTPAWTRKIIATAQNLEVTPGYHVTGRNLLITADAYVLLASTRNTVSSDINLLTIKLPIDGGLLGNHGVLNYSEAELAAGTVSVVLETATLPSSNVTLTFSPTVWNTSTSTNFSSSTTSIV